MSLSAMGGSIDDRFEAIKRDWAAFQDEQKCWNDKTAMTRNLPGIVESHGCEGLGCERVKAVTVPTKVKVTEADKEKARKSGKATKWTTIDGVEWKTVNRVKEPGRYRVARARDGEVEKVLELVPLPDQTVQWVVTAIKRAELAVAV